MIKRNLLSKIVAIVNQGIIDRKPFVLLLKTEYTVKFLNYLIQERYFTHMEDCRFKDCDYLKIYLRYDRDGICCLRRITILPKVSRTLNYKNLKKVDCNWYINIE